MKKEDTVPGSSSSSVDRVSYLLLSELNALLVLICSALYPYTPKSCAILVANTQQLGIFSVCVSKEWEHNKDIKDLPK